LILTYVIERNSVPSTIVQLQQHIDDSPNRYVYSIPYSRGVYIWSWNCLSLPPYPDRLRYLIQSPIQWVTTVLSPGVNGPEHEADHSCPSSAVVKIAWSCTSSPLHVFMAWTTLPFTFYLSTFNFHTYYKGISKSLRAESQ